MSAARKAREHLAEALGALQAEDPLAPDVLPVAERLSRVVRVLYAVEVDRDADRVVDTLRFGMERLQGLLLDLRRERGAHPEYIQTTESVAQTLSVLYPACRELERVLDPKTVDAVIPLARRREPSHDERRKNPRAEIKADIGFHTESNFFTGFSGDVSDGGIFVATYDVLAEGTELSVSFVLPNGHHITARGRVTWVRPENEESGIQPGMGVAFMSLGIDDRDAIEAFMRERSPLFHET